MMPTDTSLIMLGLVWLGYCFIHSWLASLSVKSWVKRHFSAFIPWYRLSFNGLALVLLVFPVGFMWHLSSEPLWKWHGISAWFAYGLMGAALFGFFWSLKVYDGSEFLGLRQIRLGIREVRDQERFHISPLHRYVRHPWYSLGLVLVWTQEMDPAQLVSALVITLYFVIGSYQEEKKLLEYHGEQYRRYQQQVPGLIPKPWRYLSREQADKLSGDEK